MRCCPCCGTPWGNWPARTTEALALSPRPIDGQSVSPPPGGAPASEPDTPSIPPRFAPNFLALGCAAALIVLVVAAVLVVLSFVNSFGDCGQQEVGRFSQVQVVTLDADQPMVEQDVAIAMDEATLPVDLAAGAASLSVEFEYAVDQKGSASGVGATAMPGSGEAAAAEFEVLFVRQETNRIDARVGFPPASGDKGVFRAELPLDCSGGQACARDYRVLIAWATPREGVSVSASWSVQAVVFYANSYSRCGPPQSAAVTLDAGRPNTISAGQIVRAGLASQQEDNVIVARHVTVEASAMLGERPDLGYARLSVRKANAERPAWRMWVRVMTDDGALLVDAPLGDPYTAQVDHTVEFPILADCESVASCSRGYWIIIQSFSSAPPFEGEQEAADFGELAWSLDAAVQSRTAGEQPLQLAISLDESPPDELSTRGAGPKDVVLAEPNSPRSVEIAISLEGPPPALPSDLDPLARSFVIVHAEGHGTGVRMSVTGDGAGPLTGHANGDGRWNLIAHPFDACPNAGPCHVALNLVADFAGEREYGPRGTSAFVTWRVTLIGAPEDAVTTFGEVIDLSAPGPAGLPVLAILLVLGAIAIAARYRIGPKKDH